MWVPYSSQGAPLRWFSGIHGVPTHVAHRRAIYKFSACFCRIVGGDQPAIGSRSVALVEKGECVFKEIFYSLVSVFSHA